MHYAGSPIILEKIKNASHVVVNAHKNPDVDSQSSAIAMCQMLHIMGKQVSIVCPDEGIPELQFLPCFDNFTKIDYKTFDFSPFDLFIILDSASVEVVTGSKEIALPKIPTIVLDHHKTNAGFGGLNIVDPNRSATTELLYLLFEDWGIEITKDLATALLTGILGDTGAFEYHNTTPKTLQIAAELMTKGADKDEILLRIFRSKKINLLKFWGEVLNNLQVDQSGKFTWVAIPNQVFAKLGEPQSARQSASNLFIRMVDGTDFGIVMLEEKPGLVEVSFRTRANFDVSQIAVALGGGGHSGAAATKIVGLNFDEAVKKVLDETHKFI